MFPEYCHTLQTPVIPDLDTFPAECQPGPGPGAGRGQQGAGAPGGAHAHVPPPHPGPRGRRRLSGAQVSVT